MIEAISFGAWLRHQRNLLGLTQKQFAAQVSCAVITLRKIESEQRRPSVQFAERLAQVLNIPAGEQDAFVRYARGVWQLLPVNEVLTRRSIHPPIHSLLPRPITNLIGRESDVTTIETRLADRHTPLVSLVGPPGIGKTRLGIEAAHKLASCFPDGIFFVDLASIEDSTQLGASIQHTLGLDNMSVNSPVERLASSLAGKRMLLFLDNVDHIIDEASHFIFDILQACPQIKALVTSREALRVEGEFIIHVPALNFPPEADMQILDRKSALQYSAIRLFCERAAAVQPGFSLNQENARDIAAICRQLDGLPLAIELLAARVNLMRPHTLLSHMNEYFVLHTRGSRSLPVYHRTLYQAMKWSYDLLSAEEKILFDRLSVFSSNFNLDAVESAFSYELPASVVDDLLASLIDKSLVQRTVDKLGEPCFHMLTTIKQFSIERLKETGEVPDTESQHLAYSLNLPSPTAHDING
ncbi:MAG: NB-ARC domain-containing protein [Acidobacteriaceae bacterium]